MQIIEILGIRDYEKTEILKKNTEEALTILKIKAEIYEVNDVDQFLDLRINGIPALVINGKVAFQKVIPSVSEIVQYFESLKPFKGKLKDMKKIIFPTDFSASSKNAFLYAIEVAKVFDASIEVVHCFSPAFDPNQPIVVEPLEESRKFINERLKRFVNLYPDQMLGRDNKKVEISYEALMGFPVEEIVRLSKEESPFMIVMSTTGEHNLIDKIFGSVSAAVSRNAHSPVLLIPNGVAYRPIKQIMYASNYESVEEEMIKDITLFSQIFGASIHFVHVAQEKDSLIALEDEVFRDMFDESVPPVAFEFNTIQNNDIVEGLNEYANDKKIDLAVFVTYYRSFWSNLMHRSQTRKMALNTKLPLLVMHLGD